VDRGPIGQGVGKPPEDHEHLSLAGDSDIRVRPKEAVDRWVLRPEQANAP
jgi:hypothetical protein